MYAVLELEIKLNYDEGYKYIDPKIELGKDFEDCVNKIQQKKEETIKNGYFDIVIVDRKNFVILYNGGTVYKQYNIMEVK